MLSLNVECSGSEESQEREPLRICLDFEKIKNVLSYLKVQVLLMKDWDELSYGTERLGMATSQKISKLVKGNLERVESKNKKKYCLVDTDDCSKFCLGGFLGYKDETIDMPS
ncbi:hypothetical protein Tco_0894493 [Tanacetum coccineum]|uniref:Uncharacterized protein n=1 Tax=Tanacetum coccineum TaxID=301880 RepID=A0ABQ5CF63_9ASTR